MKKNTLTVWCCLVLVNAFALDPDYAVSKIPAALLKNANAVKRYEELRFEVVNTGRTNLYRRVAITVLNENGDKYANFYQEYDKLHSLEAVDGRLFDESGKKIRSLKKSELQDLSGTDEESLADDNRIKRFSFMHKLYPYTVEYESEVKFNYTLFYPTWVPVIDESFAVEYSKVSVLTPAGIDFRFKAFNYPGQPVITADKDKKVSTWELKNYAAIEDEYATPFWFEITPVVCLAPVQFQVDEYKGNMATWQDFGKFVYALKAGRDQLPDNVKATVHALTDGISDRRKKIEALYNFLQKNTRYIGIQLGIGGWQPFDAKYVATNRYGDCKALSNYMYSLLKEAGIRSLYTLVTTGDDDRFFMSDFPSSQFNHVIICAPAPGDTIWLECTSQSVAPGYLGFSTSDRQVLLIDENGGTLARTPKYGLEQNLQQRRTSATIDEEGNLVADIVTHYKAARQDGLHSLITGLSKQKVMDYLKDEINLPTYDVMKFDYKEERSGIPIINESLQLSASNYSQVTGSRLFVLPNVMSRFSNKLIANESRKFELELNYEFRDIDTVEIKIPAGYVPESIPPAIQLDTKFGKYSCSVSVNGDKILYCRKMEKFKGRYPATAYNDLVAFYDVVYKNDRNRVVLVRK